jgi:hypothetical protein
MILQSPDRNRVGARLDGDLYEAARRLMGLDRIGPGEQIKTGLGCRNTVDA